MRLLPCLALIAWTGCKCAPSPDKIQSPFNPAAAPAPERHGPDEEVRSVYPIGAPPDEPVVNRLCKALHEASRIRKAVCCHRGVGVLMTSECIRTLGFGVSSKAVSLEPNAVDACIAAIDKALDGCEWVGPNADQIPPACVGIVHGALSEGVRCRSSLECASGLHCRGVGPTQAGTCARPEQAGAPCGRAVDTLMVYARQEGDEREHSECAGFCQRRFCMPFLGPGVACGYDAECAKGSHCAATQCAPGDVAGPGEACVGGGCGVDQRCVDGHCATPKAGGAPCRNDIECVGACLGADAGRPGKCGPGC